jgi:hypothetical protein
MKSVTIYIRTQNASKAEDILRNYGVEFRRINDPDTVKFVMNSTKYWENDKLDDELAKCY